MLKKPSDLADTERLNPRGEDLDLASIREVVFMLHQEDRQAVEAVGRVLPSISQAAMAATEALANGGRLLYVGAGTSGRLAVLDAAECPPTFGTPPEQVQAILAGGDEAFLKAVEGAEDDFDSGASAMASRSPGSSDFVVGITASGTTPFVLGALEAAKKAGAKTAVISCVVLSSEAPAVDICVVPQTGAELIAGSTRLKAGTATKLILNAISTTSMVALGKVYRGRMVDLKPTNRKLRARAQRMVCELLEVDENKASALLERADGNPKLALAMHWTGLSKLAAQEALKTQTLRELAKEQSK
jgi:N-acetylmuramic acid 6-phosphate etherase